MPGHTRQTGTEESAKMIRAFRIWRARRKLEKLIRKRQQSYAVISYRKHREAALKATRPQLVGK